MIAVFLTAGSCFSQPTAMSVHFVYILHCTIENVEYLSEEGREGAYVSFHGRLLRMDRGRMRVFIGGGASISASNSCVLLSYRFTAS